MDWEWSELGPLDTCLPCPLCQQPSCFTSAEQLLHALESLIGSPVNCNICGQYLVGLPSYLEHLTSHLPAGLQSKRQQQQQVQQLVTSYPMTVTNNMSSVTNQLPTGSWPVSQQQLQAMQPMANHQPPVTSHPPPATNHLPPVISHPPLVTSHLPPGSPPDSQQEQQAKQSMTTHALSVTTQTKASLQCPLCPRMFKTSRGRTSHMHAKHAGQKHTAVSSGTPEEATGNATTEGSWVEGLAQAPASTSGPLALLDYCLGLRDQDPSLAVASSPSPAVSSPCPTSSVQLAVFDLVGQTQAPLAEQRPTGCGPLPPLAEPPAVVGRLSPPSAIAGSTLGRRTVGGRRLRRLLQASHACQDCGRVFRLRAGLAAHRRLAHGDGACEQCSVCQRRFTSGRRLQRHLASSHGLSHTDHVSTPDEKVKENNMFECSTCKKTFTTIQFLRKHTKLHTGETPYVCDVCGRAFSLQQSYHKHQQYHTAARPYECPQCGRSFRESATLQNHMRIHSGEKPWTCETCGKSFRQRITYVVHRRIHTGALPYSCPLCHAGFRYKVSLRAHKCASSEPLGFGSGPPSAVTGDCPGGRHGPPSAATSGPQQVAAGPDPALEPPAGRPPLPPPPAAGRVGGAPLVPDTAGGQLPFRPKVSRVLLRRLVQKLRSDDLPHAISASSRHPASEEAGTSLQPPPAPPVGDRACGRPAEPAFCGNQTTSTATGLTSTAAAGLSSTAVTGLSSSVPSGLSSPTVSGLNSLEAAGLSISEPTGLISTAVAGLNSSVPAGLNVLEAAGLSGSVPAGLSSLELAGLGSSAVDELNSTAVTGLSSSEVAGLSSLEATRPGSPAAAGLDVTSGPAGAETDLDLQQLFEFPVPERSRPSLSPLHKAIESVARELANIPLCSPPAAGADTGTAGVAAVGVGSPSLAPLAGFPGSVAAAEQDGPTGSGSGPPGPEPEPAGPPSADWQLAPLSEPADLDLLFSQMFDG